MNIFRLVKENAELRKELKDLTYKYDRDTKIRASTAISEGLFIKNMESTIDSQRKEIEKLRDKYISLSSKYVDIHDRYSSLFEKKLDGE